MPSPSSGYQQIAATQVMSWSMHFFNLAYNNTLRLLLTDTT